MRLLVLYNIVFMLAFSVKLLYASQSMIVDAEGYGCMGEERSRKQTEQTALMDAKKKAIEFVSTYVKSETHVKNFALEKDLVSAYANAQVKVLQELEKGWYKDQNVGECYKMKIKAEVTPDEKAYQKIEQYNQTAEDPSNPLTVSVWTDKKEYMSGEKVRIYVKGNKPFYARVLYKDVDGSLVQLFPNPYRQDSYFNGGTVYDLPSGNDKFELEVRPPFGEESIVVYAGSVPLGDIEIQTRGGVYQVQTEAKDIGNRTRSIKLMGKINGDLPATSEFYEATVKVKTRREP